MEAATEVRKMKAKMAEVTAHAAKMAEVMLMETCRTEGRVGELCFPHHP
jgi:hypothetical protein